MPLKTIEAYFPEDCTVTSKLGRQSTISAGIHPVTELQTMGGGVTIDLLTNKVDIYPDEWFRLQKEGLVREVP
jgi:hypothetical protein